MNTKTRALMEAKAELACRSSYSIVEKNIYRIGYREGAEAMDALAKEREAKLEAALNFYTNSGKTKTIRGRIIEFDPDAGPLYETYEVPMCDDGTVARQALADYHAAKGESNG